MDVQTQVIKFYTGKTTTGKDKWDVYFADGTKATAWEYAVAARASEALNSGAFVTVSIEEKPNGNGGVYRNLKAVSPANGTGAILSPPALSPGQNPPLLGTGAQNGSGEARAPLSSGGMSAEDKIRVTKLSCISSAAAIFSGSGDVQETLKAARLIFQEVWDVQPLAPVVAPQPAVVAAFANTEAGAPVVQVGTEAVVTEQPATALPWAVV